LLAPYGAFALATHARSVAGVSVEAGQHARPCGARTRSRLDTVVV
jgi:hypothetical protein